MGRTGHMEYAIVDIETTGGYAAGSGITEIAILIHDGVGVVDRFTSLVNPQRPIPLYIQAMTGISDELVADSPTFGELAAEIHRWLDGRVFVAHNVNFDYSFLRHHLEETGYRWTAPKLCTVRMSRKIRPGLPSYSLGRLCDALGIAINNRHRALGDAEATAVLFGNLLEWDNGGIIAEMLKKTSKHQQLPPNLPKEAFDTLPHGAGVYYFRDRGGKIIYVGKALDIRKRVLQHFSGHNPNPQRQHFLRHIHSIAHEPCGSELMALLLEAVEIKRLWPVYNRALKRFEPKYALYTYEDHGGYLRLAVGKHGKHLQPIHVFHNQSDAMNLLHRLIREFDLLPAYCVFGIPAARSGTALVPNGDIARDTANVTPANHNVRVKQAIAHLTENLPSFALVDQGRDADEYGCIWVEQGRFYGMGYISRESDINTPEAVKESLTRYDSNQYVMQLIYGFAAKHPSKVWRPGQATPVHTAAAGEAGYSL